MGNFEKNNNLSDSYINSQLDVKITNFIDNYNQLDMFREIISPILRSKKQEELTLKYRKMYRLMGRYSALSVYNKLMLYQQVLKPVWTYGIQLWGCTGQSNRNII